MRALRAAPVDVKPARDGSLYISEDRNGTVLRFVLREPRRAADSGGEGRN